VILGLPPQMRSWDCSLPCNPPQAGIQQATYFNNAAPIVADEGAFALINENGKGGHCPSHPAKKVAKMPVHVPGINVGRYDR
jgi:hypothetical protein